MAVFGFWFLVSVRFYPFKKSKTRQTFKSDCPFLLNYLKGGKVHNFFSEFAYFYYILYLLVMVNGRRRRPAHYPLNIRHHGYSSKELSNAIKFKRFIAVFSMEYFQYPTALLLVNGNRLAVNPTFVRVNRFLVSFSDHQLYHIQIKNRTHIPRLIAALHIPSIVTCDNGSIMPGEEDFLLLFFFLLVFFSSDFSFCSGVLWPGV